MRKNSMVVFFLLIILILSACNNVDEKEPVESVDVSTVQSDGKEYQAQILKVDTDLEVKDGWHMVPKGVNRMTISVEAENVETILFWISETGTGTWAERTLIGYDIDGNDGWSIEWEFGDRIFHDHITVQALGSDFETQARETLNVHSVDQTDK
ncbi:hypothetical protein [Sporosarcina luteola]|uniref:hypothetical protein n=1 Tax=Sporosarcina luteola TaxID=582850 RepID=UPI00203E9772|nr:hypothetical protein [Sporosarcina luteola]MCM3711014.1 hypothetical protein [Sporosarcina luteola]